MRSRMISRGAPRGGRFVGRIPIQSISRGTGMVDARSLIRNKPDVIPKVSHNVDARSLLNKKTRPFGRPVPTFSSPRPASTIVPMKIPKVTIKNDLYNKQPDRNKSYNIVNHVRSNGSSTNSNLRSISSRASTSNSMNPTSSPPPVNTVSCIQGFRVEIKGLRPTVVLEDIYELFGCVGKLRSCKMIRNGVAEVIFQRYGDALEAVKRYNDRELDEWPMRITIMTKVDQQTAYKLAKDRTYLSKSAKSMNDDYVRYNEPNDSNVDMGVFYKALFNVSSPTSSHSRQASSRRPVDFNVNLS